MHFVETKRGYDFRNPGSQVLLFESFHIAMFYPPRRFKIVWPKFPIYFLSISVHLKLSSMETKLKTCFLQDTKKGNSFVCRMWILSSPRTRFPHMMLVSLPRQYHFAIKAFKCYRRFNFNLQGCMQILSLAMNVFLLPFASCMGSRGGCDSVLLPCAGYPGKAKLELGHNRPHPLHMHIPNLVHFPSQVALQQASKQNHTVLFCRSECSKSNDIKPWSLNQSPQSLGLESLRGPVV